MRNDQSPVSITKWVSESQSMNIVRDASAHLKTEWGNYLLKGIVVCGIVLFMSTFHPDTAKLKNEEIIVTLSQKTLNHVYSVNTSFYVFKSFSFVQGRNYNLVELQSECWYVNFWFTIHINLSTPNVFLACFLASLRGEGGCQTHVQKFWCKFSIIFKAFWQHKFDIKRLFKGTNVSNWR